MYINFTFGKRICLSTDKKNLYLSGVFKYTFFFTYIYYLSCEFKVRHFRFPLPDRSSLSLLGLNVFIRDTIYLDF